MTDIPGLLARIERRQLQSREGIITAAEDDADGLRSVALSMPAMEEAIAAGLRISLALVQKCRKAISACLRGRRSRVTWLRPRNR